MERKAKMNVGSEYSKLVEQAFEMWYIYDNYELAIQKFNEAIKVAADPEEIKFCNNNIELIKRNDESDLATKLNDIM